MCWCAIKNLHTYSHAESIVASPSPDHVPHSMAARSVIHGFVGVPCMDTQMYPVYNISFSLSTHRVSVACCSTKINTYRLRTACIEINNAGTPNVSKKISAAFSRLCRGFNGTSVSRMGCCRQFSQNTRHRYKCGYNTSSLTEVIGIATALCRNCTTRLYSYNFLHAIL